MNICMMNKCAKFHGIVQKKSKIQSPERDWIFGDGRFCVELCIETLCKRPTSVAHLTNFSFEFFYALFTEVGSLLLLYHIAKNQKWPKTQIKGVLPGRISGPLIDFFPILYFFASWYIKSRVESCVEIALKISKGKLVKSATTVGLALAFCTKLHTKLAISRSSVSLAGMNLKVCDSLDHMKLGTLIHHVHGSKGYFRFLNFCSEDKLWSFKV